MAHYYTRRRPNLVDLSFDPEPLLGTNTDAWRIKRASNWDGSFTQLVDIPFRGKRASEVPNTFNPENIQNRYVRYLFDPAATHNLEDDTVQYLRVASLSGGTEQNVSRTLIIPTPEQVQTTRPPLVLRGDAPVASDFDNGERLVLPTTAVSYEIENNGSNAIYIGYGSEGSELKIPAGERRSDNRLQVEEVNLRTDGAAGSPSAIQLYLVLAQGPAL